MKPDRFERLVTTECGTAYGCTYQQMIALLRRQHNAVVRLVKRTTAIKSIVGHGLISRQDLLAALAERAT